MAVKIGHSAIDENGGIYGGQAGDQNGREVCIGTYYNMRHNVVLRPKKAGLAENAAVVCEKACDNDNIGYAQDDRNTLYARAKEVGFDMTKITTPCECDCSSLQHVLAIAGGANLTYGSNGLTTRTMVNAFVNSGDYEKLTDDKYLTSDKYLLRGDVLVREGSHTVMILSDGECALEERYQYSESYKKTYVVTEELALRVQPDADTTAVAYMPKGVEVVCDGYYDMYGRIAWYHVKYNDYEGFCCSVYLKEKVEEVVTPKYKYSDSYKKTYVVTTPLNMRKEPDADADIVVVLPKDAEVVCDGTYDMYGNNPWLHVKYNDYEGFCSSRYLVEKVVEEVVEEPKYKYSDSYKKTYVVTEELNLRKEPDADTDVVAVMPKGAEVVCDGTYDMYGRIAWLQVKYNGYEGFCCSVYLEEKVEEVVVTPTPTPANKFMWNGLDCALIFNPTYYSDKYADLKKAFGYDEDRLFHHFLNWGMNERRQATATFDVVAYQSYYEDLRRAFGDKMPLYYKHYLEWGHNEGRKTI